MQAFQDAFNLSPELQKAIGDMGFERPTPIQESSIPPMLEGRDVIGQAQTGTGKTAAFGIPLMDAIDHQRRHVQALVLCPTRELCMQTAGELVKLGRYRRGLSTLAVYGGAPIGRQLRGLQDGAQVVVGTPGRVMDHINRGALRLDQVRIAVLDEADEMLDMGFRDDIETILQNTPDTRQTALFSATMPREIMTLGRRYTKDPVHIQVAAKEMTVDRIKQSYISVRSFHKIELLSRLLVKDEARLSLVFVNTKRGVEEVVSGLTARGFAAAGLHGDMRQIEREAIMARFKQGMVNVLVATDVAARGLDIENIDTVFNYDLPQDVEYYVHRIGRTGRAGREGRAYSFVVGREVSRMWDYRRITRATILCEQPPSGESIKQAQAERRIAEISAAIDASSGSIMEPTSADMAKALLEGRDHEAVVASLLDQLLNSGLTRIHPEMDICVPEPPRMEQQARPAYAPPRRGPYGQPVRKDAGRPYSPRSGSGGGNAKPYNRHRP